MIFVIFVVEIFDVVVLALVKVDKVVIVIDVVVEVVVEVVVNVVVDVVVNLADVIVIGIDKFELNMVFVSTLLSVVIIDDNAVIELGNDGPGGFVADALVVSS